LLGFEVITAVSMNMAVVYLQDKLNKWLKLAINKKHIFHISCEMSGSRVGEYEDGCLLGFYAV
jgi:hypothetical protein